jgi:hypothetical protein
MTVTAVRNDQLTESDPFLLEIVPADALTAWIDGDLAGPVARTCNCYGTCGSTINQTGTECTFASTTCLER